MKTSTKQLLRSLPSISTLLEHEEVVDWLNGLPRSSVVSALQSSLDAARSAILAGELKEPVDTIDILASAEEELVEQSIPSLRRVINATGIVLHTGLGRAPLCDAAVEAIVEGASGYCNLEYDLDTGSRGRRSDHISELLSSLTGAEAATVVNNNAAATFLILQTFAAGAEVVVSRGQLIEIGGSFRLPDIMSASGATLREVGTTNRTRLGDYENAINDNTAMLLRVHTSNYKIVGFTEEVAIDELAELAHRSKLLAVDDLGSGVLFDPTERDLPGEPSVPDSIAAGADLACFSGDKLLGGPQCGLIVGKEKLIDKIEANPLMRTYRVDKLTLLALEATLRQYIDLDDAFSSVPTLSMLHATTDQLASRAQTLVERLKKALPDEEFLVCSDVGFAGGGAMPGDTLDTVVVQWRPSVASVDETTAELRDAEVPVIVRIRDDAICFDLRTLRESDFDDLIDSVYAATCEEEEDEGDEETESDGGNGLSLPVI